MRYPRELLLRMSNVNFTSFRISEGEVVCIRVEVCVVFASFAILSVIIENGVVGFANVRFCR